MKKDKNKLQLHKIIFFKRKLYKLFLKTNYKHLKKTITVTKLV